MGNMNKESNTFNVLCATDENYVPYCGVMITSLFENNNDLDLCVFIITDTQLSWTARRKFKLLSSKYNHRIEIVNVDRSRFENYPTKNMSYWSIAMYYRILAAEILPESVNHVLYLDCDIIVTSSIKKLFNIKVDDYAVGAVIDICSDDKKINDRLQYPREYPYFNSGVLLINLSYWRKFNIGKQCLNYLFSNYDKLSANDQDVLNAVLYDKTVLLPITYNYQVLFKKKDVFNLHSEQIKQMISRIRKPTIIHYAMQTKPWDIRYYKMPYAEEWKHYKHKSPWWYLFPLVPRPHALKYIVKRYMIWPLGIMYNWQGIEFNN